MRHSLEPHRILQKWIKLWVTKKEDCQLSDFLQLCFFCFDKAELGLIFLLAGGFSAAACNDNIGNSFSQFICHFVLKFNELFFLDDAEKHEGDEGEFK